VENFRLDYWAWRNGEWDYIGVETAGIIEIPVEDLK